MVGERETSTVPDEELELRGVALERLRKRRDFSTHLVAYVLINAAVWAIWAVTGSGYPWPMWMSGAWAIGLLLNAWELFGRPPITEADVRREVERLRPQH